MKIQLNEPDNIWNQTRAQLRTRLSDSTFQMWIEPLRAASFERGVLVLESPESVRAWVQNRFSSTISEVATFVQGSQVDVDIQGVQAELAGSRRTSVTPDLEGNPSAQGSPDQTLDLNPKLTFDQFVIGEANRLAHAAALATAEMPAQTYNPLFIYGPPGTGKTHLLHAIGNLASEHSPELRVRLATAEQFTARFVNSIQRGDLPSFKREFRDVDLLLVDDAQFLSNKTKTEEEFFHTFNDVVGSGAQVVITCDRTPEDLDSLETRLRDRFSSGLVVDITSLDTPTRIAILATRAKRDALGDIPLEAIEAIAERIKGNGRSLEGALIRVVAYASLTGARLTRDLTTQVLDQLYPERSIEPRQAISSREIKEMVAETFGVRTEDLDSKSRSANIVWPRQVAMYLSREIAGDPLPEIGSSFGGRNHSTVINACKRVRQRVSSDPKAAITVKSLERRILGGDDRP